MTARIPAALLRQVNDWIARGHPVKVVQWIDFAFGANAERKE